MFTLIGGLVLCVGAGACSRDTRLTGRRLRSVTVKPVTYYDVTLDESATPKQVVYVLLRAIREDFLAKTPAEREAALDKQFDLAAADVIAARNKTSVSQDEFLYGVVYHWTPTVSHYVNDFETTWDAAAARLVESTPTKANDESGTVECDVRMVLNDPSGDENARVVMVVWLAKDHGMWRVTHLGFDPRQRSLAGSG